MANDYFAKSGNPSANSLGDSSLIRAEITALEAAFDKLAGLTGNGDKIVVINTGGTGQTVKTAAELKTLLGLVIGTNVQAQDATLQSLSALGTAADKLAYTTGVDTWAEAILTSVARTLLAQTTQALMRTTGLGATAIGDALFLAATAAAGRATLGVDLDLIATSLDRDVTVNEVVNTITETTVYSFSVPANTLSTNRSLRLSMIGDVLSNTGIARNLTIRVKFGATTIFTRSDGFSDSATRYGHALRLSLSAANATNAQVSEGTWTPKTSVGVTGEVSGANRWTGMHTSIAEDSTLAQTLAITFELSAASASLSARCHTVLLELI